MKNLYLQRKLYEYFTIGFPDFFFELDFSMWGIKFNILLFIGRTPCNPETVAPL